MVKNVKLMALFLVALSFGVRAQSNTNWYTGSDSSAGEFRISSAEELRGLAYLVNNSIIPVAFAGKTIVLSGDIDLGGESFTPIGKKDITNHFQGIFDGGGYTISGLSVDSPPAAVAGEFVAGLFGYVGKDGQIKNVNIVAANINVANAGTAAVYAGGLAARYDSAKPIQNCSVQVDLTTISTSGKIHVGGLVGHADSALTVVNSRASVNISVDPVAAANSYSGGLAGYAGKAANFENCSASGDVSGFHSGGLVGYAHSAVTITKSCTGGMVTGKFSGGLVGYANNAVTIENSYTNGDISGISVSGDSFSGGLAGWFGASATVVAKITNCYTSGTIDGFGPSGGIFGRYFYNKSSEIKSTHYNSDAVDAAAGVVYRSLTDFGPAAIPGTLGQSDADLKKRETFAGAGWDFDCIWTIREGEYPYFKSGLGTGVYVAPIPESTYTGDEITPDPVIRTVYGAALVKGRDYNVSYRDNINAGTGAVIIEGLGQYADVLSGEALFMINPQKLTAANVVFNIDIVPYTGSSVIPQLISLIRVTDADGSKILGSADYTVSCSGSGKCINEGPAAAEVSGKGNYTGTVPLSFNIGKTEARNPNTDWYTSNPNAGIFVISGADELAGLAALVNKGNNFSGRVVTLDSDIDLSGYGRSSKFNGGKGWIPIGNSQTYSFNGVFNGNGKTVSSVHINDRSFKHYLGLFGHVRGGEIRNLGVTDVRISVDTSYFVGGVAGYVEGNVVNCYSAGAEVTGGRGVGGVVGYIYGSMANCYSAIEDINSKDYVGGIVGYAYKSSVTSCAALNKTVAATAGSNAGRVFGQDTLSIAVSGNIAFSGMRDVHFFGSATGAGTKNGASITIQQIHADGTLGGMFREDDGWTAVPGKLPGLFGKTVDMPVHLGGAVSVLSGDRVIPKINQGAGAEAAVIASAGKLAGELAVGPNPVGRQAGTVNFFRQGKRVENGVLTIYGASGNFIRTIAIRDNAAGALRATPGGRQVGSWDLTDSKGHPVHEGTYLARGVLKLADGSREKVSLLINVK